MKKAVWIAGILIALALIAGLALNGRAEVEYAAEGEGTRISADITPRAKLLAIMYGGYEELYGRLRAEGMTGPEAMDFISKGLGERLDAMAEGYNLPAADAAVRFTGNYNEPFVFTEGRAGKVADKEKLYLDTAKSLDSGGNVSVSVIRVEPEITRESLVKLYSKRAEFSTGYAESVPARKSNIALAAKYLNGACIEPMGTISFNEAVGPRTAPRGFLKANTIVNGEMVPGTGGGVCQVSSTVYNACLLSGLSIAEAGRHSRVVGYIGASRDAMVSDVSDLKVINATGHDIYIMAKAEGDRIYIAIYGESLSGEYKIKSEIIKTIDPKPDLITVSGENIAEDVKRALLGNDPEALKNIAYKETRLRESRSGLISEAYLEYFEGGRLFRSTLISRDTYLPQQGIISRELV